MGACHRVSIPAARDCHDITSPHAGIDPTVVNRRVIAAAVGLFLLSVTICGAKSAEAPEKTFGQLRFGAVTLTPQLRLTDIGSDTNGLNLQDSSPRRPEPGFARPSPAGKFGVRVVPCNRKGGAVLA